MNRTNGGEFEFILMELSGILGELIQYPEKSWKEGLDRILSPPTIRSATPADAERVARIYIDSWNAGFGALLSRADRIVTPELTERWRHDLAQPVPLRWWVAERAGSIAGFSGIGPSRDPADPRLGELDTIAICPLHWRTGIGKALMAVALRYLVADGYVEAVVWTVEGYERGIAFYEAMGWRRDGGTRADGRQIRFRRGWRSSPPSSLPNSGLNREAKQ